MSQDSWLARETPLHEQGVKDDEILVFGRSFFGENIDQSDPFHLHLAYLQCIGAIVDGDYPCPLKQAIRFAAIKMQVDFGDFDPNDSKTIKYVFSFALE